MNMKRPLAFLLAAGMTLGLAACGGNGGTSGSGSSGSSGSADGSAVTLDLWAFNIGGFTEASNWDTILAAFNEQHPDITVNVTPINYQDGDQKLTSAITSNSGPDIIFEGPERIVGNYAREGLMVDLSDLWTESGSDIAEGISSVSQLDGTYYMYPLSVAAHCMAINYEVFEAAGALQYIDEETRTWSTDDFVAAMEAIKTAIDNGTVSLATPGIVYCGGHPRSGEQPVLRLLRKRRRNLLQRQQRQQREGSDPAAGDGERGLPVRQRQLRRRGRAAGLRQPDLRRHLLLELLQLHSVRRADPVHPLRHGIPL